MATSAGRQGHAGRKSSLGAPTKMRPAHVVHGSRVYAF
jgi:hypothetical protein